MSEKKYIGKGKTTQYSKNCQINLNSLFEAIYKDTQDKSIAKAFEMVKTTLNASNLTYLNKWKDKDGKDKFDIKISITNLQQPDKIGNDLTIYLNEFIPVQQVEKPQAEAITVTDSNIADKYF